MKTRARAKAILEAWASFPVEVQPHGNSSSDSEHSVKETTRKCDHRIRKIIPRSPVNNSRTSPPPRSQKPTVMHNQSKTTEDQEERMVLITNILQSWNGEPKKLFEEDTWKALIRAHVLGTSLEKRYKSYDRLTDLAKVIIDQISSDNFCNQVYQILLSKSGRLRTCNPERAREFLTLCAEYDVSRGERIWKLAKGQDDQNNSSLSSSSSSSEPTEAGEGGWVTDEEGKYVGPILNTDVLCQLNSSCDEEIEEKENDSPKSSRTTRSCTRNSSPLPLPLGVKKPRYNNTKGRNLRGTAKIGKIRPPALAHLLAREFSESPVEDDLTLQLEVTTAAPIFVMNNYDEVIENETPPATPLDGDLSSEPHFGCSPSKRTRLSSRDNTGLCNGSPVVMDEPILKPAGGGDLTYTIRSGSRTVVGYVGNVQRYNGNFDYLADSSPPKDADDDNSSNSDQHGRCKDKENLPKSEQEIVRDYPKPQLAPELKPFMFEEIQIALSKSKEDKVVSGFSLTIKQEHLAIYNQPEWLEDANIDFYLELIKDRNNREGSPYPTVYIFRSFFYKILEKNGYDSVKGATGKDDIFQYDLVLIPIHTRDHWILVVVDFRNKTMSSYDSMDNNNFNHLKTVEKFMLREWSEKSASKNSTGGNEDANIESSKLALTNDASVFGEEWEVCNLGAVELPQQTNGRDCGIFCLQFAEYVSRNQAFDFEQRHMAYFRKRMLYETLKKSLLIE